MNKNIDLSKIGRTENSKQVEYLNDIRTIGMGIIFGQVEAPHFIETFEPYIDYMETPSEYLDILKRVSQAIHESKCSPDDLLIRMGKFVPDIQYEDEQITYEYDEYDEDDEYDSDEDDITIDVNELSDEDIHRLLSVLLKD